MTITTTTTTELTLPEMLIVLGISAAIYVILELTK